MASIGVDLLRRVDSNATVRTDESGSRWEMVLYIGDETVGLGDDSTQVKPLALLHEMEQNSWIQLDTTNLAPMEIAVSDGEGLYR